MTASSTLRLVHHGGPFAAAAVAVGFGCSDVATLGSKHTPVLLHSPASGLPSSSSAHERQSEVLRAASHAAALRSSGAEASVRPLLAAAWLNKATAPLDRPFPLCTLWQQKLPAASPLTPFHRPPLAPSAALSLARCRAEEPSPALGRFFLDQGRASSNQEASTSGSGAAASAAAGPTFSFHSWHVPVPGTFSEAGGNSAPIESSPHKPPLVVVILGWLGSKQKHLKKYADWYTQQGIHCVTFTIPMASVLSVGKGGRAEEHIDSLVSEIKTWMVEINGGQEGEEAHSLVFHTFSNTGWLMYGAVLERLHKEGSTLLGSIKGCVVDSAPVMDPDPQVWASGFVAALLGKRASAARYDDIASRSIAGTPPAPTRVDMKEALLHSALERFFSIFLQLPLIRKRLAEVTAILAEKQPSTPQLYIYSSADRVIPAQQVERFIAKQKQQGRAVWAKNMHSSPHVDHFRSHPAEYTQQLRHFLQHCVPGAQTEPREPRGATPMAEA